MIVLGSSVLTTASHRLSTITKADQIIVLHQGHIVEKGTHAQLLAAGGLYGQMWEKQTKAKEKEDRDEENRDLVEFP
jgi:ABC-type multidrug transport system fused ATPase/permease subunit